jgi:hypothetical protein
MSVLYKLEAQWTEHLSLTVHSVLRKFYTEPSDDGHKVIAKAHIAFDKAI